MILTTRARYAVMAMVELAILEQDSPCKLVVIAKNQKIDLAYLEQIFNNLKNADLVSSFRGPNGGYKLARKSTEIRIIDIVKAVNEPLEMTRCRQDNSCIDSNHNAKCLTHKLWLDLTQHIETFLTDLSIEDVIKDNQWKCENNLSEQRI